MQATQHGSGGSRPDLSAKAIGDREIQPVLSDRQLHDRVITYLTDANLRYSGTSNEFLDEGEANRAQRFSRFLARRYYRDRLQRSFRYSSSVVSQTRAASDLADRSEFDGVLDNCVLGSFATSREVGQLAVAALLPLRNEAWWPELLEYESALFLQLATSEVTPAGNSLRVCVSTAIRSFTFRIPELLSSLRAGRLLPISGNTTLLFSRTTHGRIYVVELDAKTEAVFTAISRGEDVQQLVADEDVTPDEMQQTLNTLHVIGAVTSSLPDLEFR
jgi:hypothetical protein